MLIFLRSHSHQLAEQIVCLQSVVDPVGLPLDFMIDLGSLLSRVHGRPKQSILRVHGRPQQTALRFHGRRGLDCPQSPCYRSKWSALRVHDRPRQSVFRVHGRPRQTALDSMQTWVVYLRSHLYAQVVYFRVHVINHNLSLNDSECNWQTVYLCLVEFYRVWR